MYLGNSLNNVLSAARPRRVPEALAGRSPRPVPPLRPSVEDCHSGITDRLNRDSPVFGLTRVTSHTQRTDIAAFRPVLRIQRGRPRNAEAAFSHLVRSAMRDGRRERRATAAF